MKPFCDYHPALSLSQRGHVGWVKRIAFLMFLSGPAFSQPNCPLPKYMAPLPASIENPNRPWGKTDTGAIVDGFVGLKTVPELIHGIDLSSNNVIKDYGKYSRCGAKFAFIRLDSAFTRHSQALATQQWTTIPYVFMPIPTQMRHSASYSRIHSDNSELIDRELNSFAEAGTANADELPDALQQVGLKEVPRISFAGLSGRLIALDVEQKLDVENNATARLYYGRFYARSICSWIAKTKLRYPDIIIIIYSTPSVFGDYLNFAYQQDDNCLRGIPIWMARTTRDGGDLIGVSGSKEVNDLYSQRTCLQPAGNRCIVHQYSHRGVVGAVLPVSDPSTPHVDFDRAFPVKTIQDSKTTQYVRR
ncbi:hypothetical protein [Paraburkholderia sp. BL17N1]|uniref:hypothetical protein n=1 Tax=Paraburkholderia sp. BL17N1 TaxID=1938798 RepID=UPI000F28EF2A|nr:hypothetical protein [Paraburkholderia sp. BL17N1]RKR31167.1 hypothetical protein B0G82_7294 [Paraburkholderia sp. BL17N1]